MNQLIWLMIIGLFFAGSAHAATVFGQIYDGETFQPLSKAIVQINTTPQQTQVTDENGYSFTIPDSGIFTISATFVSSNMDARQAENKVTVIEKGTYRVDIILFSDLNESQGLKDLLDETASDNDLSSLDELGTNQAQSIQVWLPIVIVLLLVMLIGVGWWFFSTQKPKPLTAPTIPLAEKSISIPNEKKEEAISFIQKRGGRVLQKDLRQELNLGEAYASLVVAELESEGRLKKIKHGRGNILVLKD